MPSAPLSPRRQPSFYNSWMNKDYRRYKSHQFKVTNESQIERRRVFNRWVRVTPMFVLSLAMASRAWFILAGPNWSGSAQVILASMFLAGALLAAMAAGASPWFVMPFPLAEVFAIVIYGTYAVVATEQFGYSATQGVVADQFLICVLVGFMWDDARTRVA